jgi:hypothetical protein
LAILNQVTSNKRRTKFKGEADQVPSFQYTEIVNALKGVSIVDTVKQDTPSLMENNPYGVLVT